MTDLGTSSGEPLAYQINQWWNGNAINRQQACRRFDSQPVLYLTLVQILLNTNL